MNPEPASSKLRKMELTEFDRMTELMEVAFAEDTARDGRSLREDMAGVRPLLPALRILMKIRPGFEDKFYTLVREVEGRFVSAITLSQQGNDRQRWYIFNVATHPDFRGRGLARKLVAAALDHIRARGGQRVLLDVRADNVAAYQLYRSVGFLQLETSTLLKGSLSQLPACAWPANCSVRRIGEAEWQPAFDLEQRLASAATRAVCPTTPDQFQNSLFTRVIQRVISRAQKQRPERWLVERAGKSIGLATNQIRLAGNNPHRVRLSIDPAEVDIGPALLTQTINQGVNGAAHGAVRPFLIDVPGNSSASGFLKSIGCEEIETLHQLGLAL
jgi:GNAT superfamily N-acetyltransferase